MNKRNTTALAMLNDIMEFDNLPAQAVSKLKELQRLMVGLAAEYEPHPDPVSALKSLPALVRLKESTFEDDWTEAGMIGYLTSMIWDHDENCYQLVFEFGDFIEYNKSFLIDAYYPNDKTKKAVAKGALENKPLYNAIEAEQVENTVTTFYSPVVDGNLIENRDDEACIASLLNELVEPVIECYENPLSAKER